MKLWLATFVLIAGVIGQSKEFVAASAIPGVADDGPLSGSEFSTAMPLIAQDSPYIVTFSIDTTVGALGRRRCPRRDSTGPGGPDTWTGPRVACSLKQPPELVWLRIIFVRTSSRP